VDKQHRLRRKTDFDAVYKTGRTTSDRLLVVRVRSRADATAEPARLGYVTTRALGNAVTRNRTKRRLRAAAHALKNDIAPGLDIIISARKPAATEPYATLARSVRTLLTRAGAIAAERDPE
jgi:ribonuclease P protein component